MKADTKSLQDELLETTRAIDMASNPFIIALANGTASRDALRRYAIDTYLLAYFFRSAWRRWRQSATTRKSGSSSSTICSKKTA